MRIKFFILLFSISSLLFPAQVRSDEQLRKFLGPEDFTYIRFIQANPDLNSAPQVNDEKYPLQKFKSVTPYYTLPWGKINLSFGNKTLLETLQPKRFYSVVSTRSDLLILEDRSLKFPGKSLLSFYNFTNQKKITLKLTERNINIIDGVESNKSGFRELRSGDINMSAFDENNKQIAIFNKFSIKPGVHYSIIAFENKKKKIEIENINSIVNKEE